MVKGLRSPNNCEEKLPLKGPPFVYPDDSIYGYLDAVIDSSSAKTLAQPTLLVQEG